MEEKEKPKESKSSLFKGFACSECRTYEHPVPKIYKTIIDCTKFHEWWPKSFTSTVEVCTPEVIGSIVNFTSDWGNYSATISELKDNEEMKIEYDKGILNGSQVWKLKELDPITDDAGNFIPRTEVCYDANIIPTTKKLQIFTSFLSDASKRSYFSPLLDSLEIKMSQLAAEERREKEELALQKQIQEQELTILQEEDEQLQELKNIQLGLNQVQAQINQYVAKLEAQKAQRERHKFLNSQKPVVVGTPPPPPSLPPPSEPVAPSTPSIPSSAISIPEPSPPTPTLPPTPTPSTPPAEAPPSFEPTPAPPTPLPEPPVHEIEQPPAIPSPASIPSPAPAPVVSQPTPISNLFSLFGIAKAENQPEPPQESSTTTSSPKSSLPPALVSVLNPPPIVVAVANSTKSSMDDPFSQVTIQEPRSFERTKHIEIKSIEEPIVVVPINRPDLPDSS